MLDKIVEKTKERVSENKKVNSLDRLKYKILNIDVKFNYPFKKALSSWIKSGHSSFIVGNA